MMHTKVTQITAIHPMIRPLAPSVQGPGWKPSLARSRRNVGIT